MRVRKFVTFLGVGLGLALSFAPRAWSQGTTYSLIAAGRYLVDAGDCASCHTDTAGKPFAGGRAIQTPFGVIYSSNITPDSETGIGKWSEKDFYDAMHHGMSRTGKYLYPAFPYPWFTKVSADDVRAIKAYLDTIPPVRQRNRRSKLPWPLSVRSVMAGWNALYFQEGVFQPDANKSVAWNRGAYLVQGLGHCGACHTATNAVGAPKKHQRLMGGDFGKHWYAPNLTRDLGDGLGNWSVEEIVEYLKTGSNGKDAAGGPMAEVVENSTQYLSDSDLDAMATYLKDIPAHENSSSAPAVAVADRTDLTRGQALYDDNCTGCHMVNGAGLAQVFPSLKESSAVQAKVPDTLIHFILAGARKAVTPGKPTGLSMPAFSGKLDDGELADLVNYIRNAWGNHAPLTDASAVSKVRKEIERSGELNARQPPVQAGGSS